MQVENATVESILPFGFLFSKENFFLWMSQNLDNIFTSISKFILLQGLSFSDKKEVTCGEQVKFFNSLDKTRSLIKDGF